MVYKIDDYVWGIKPRVLKMRILKLLWYAHFITEDRESYNK